MEAIAIDGTKICTGDPVLVRYADHHRWLYGLFSHHVYEGAYACAGGRSFPQCIPYKGNEHLVGTKDIPQIMEPPFTFGDKVEVRDAVWENWRQGIFVKKEAGREFCFFSVLSADGLGIFKLCRHADW